MPINIPSSAQQVENRSKTDVQRSLPESNPFLKNSWLGALITSFANRIFDFYLQLLVAIRDNMPDTAMGDRLIRWANIWGKKLNSATQSSGRMVATGTNGGVIPIDTVISVSGQNYRATGSSTITSRSIAVQEITRSGTVVQVVTVDDHGLADNVPVSISDVDQPEYNVEDQAITVTGVDTFEYEILGTPVTPATGAPVLQAVYGGVSVISDGFGVDTNLDPGTRGTLQSPLLSVDDSLVVDAGGVGGGTDQQTPEELRGALLDRIQNPVAHFNVAEISDKAREVPGVTRVFVQPITPAVGQVTVYFMRDGDANPIPVASEVATVKDSILEIMPANTATSDVIVLAPAPTASDFIFTALVPDTPTMRSAVVANLKAFYEETPEVGEDISPDAYRSAIYNTVDQETGQVVESFALSSPSGPIAVGSGGIGTLGQVDFNL